MNNCIISNKPKDSDGYGRIYDSAYGNNKSHHRYVYEQHYGPIPRGLVVRHKCDNPSCINIEHLELGTIQDNVNDRVKRNRSCVGTQHHNNKLTEQDVLDIRAKEGTLLLRELAELYNVNIATIHNILKRKIWKHI